MLRTALCCAALALTATCDADPPPRAKLVLVGEPDPPSSRLGEIPIAPKYGAIAPTADGAVAIDAEARLLWWWKGGASAPTRIPLRRLPPGQSISILAVNDRFVRAVACTASEECGPYCTVGRIDLATGVWVDDADFDQWVAPEHVSADGDSIVTVDATENLVYRVSLANGHESREPLWSPRTKAHRWAISPDGKRAAALCADGAIEIWMEGKGGRRYETRFWETDGVQLTVDERSVLVKGYGTMGVWDLEEGKYVYKAEGWSPSPPRGRLLSIESLQLAELYDLVDRKAIRRQSLDLGLAAEWLRSEDGKRVFVFQKEDGRVVVLDGGADRILLDERKHRDDVAHLSLANYPSYVTTWGRDGKAIRWSGRDGRWLDTFLTGCHPGVTHGSCMSADGRHVAVTLIDGFNTWRTDWFALDGKRVRRTGSMRDVELSQFLRSGHLVLSRVGSDPIVVDPRTGRLASPQPLISNEAICPAENVDRGRSDPDDDFSAWVNDREWLLDGQHASRYATHAGWLATFDACGRRLRLFERDTGQMLWERTLWDTAPEQRLGGPVFSPRGDVLCARVDRDVRFWDVCTGRPLGRMRVGDLADWQPPAFAPDGTAVGVVPSWEAGYPMVLPVPRPVPDPSDATLAEMWRRLGGDAPVAYRAARAIAHRGAEGAAFLAAQMPAVPLPRAPELQAWHERLDAPDYRTRTAAQHAFAALPHPASLAESLRKHPVNADARRFLDRIVEQERRGPTTADALRAVRAVTALELIGEPALPTLDAWAARDDSRQARAAREAAARVRAARFRP